MIVNKDKQSNAAKLDRLANLLSRVHMGGIDSEATREELIVWIATGQTVWQQRATPAPAISRSSPAT